MKGLREGLVALILVTLQGSGSAWAAPAAETKDQGKALLTRMCGNCHAVGPTGDSSHRGAPPFRKIGERYNITELTERMA
jgi:cytochrome c553